MTTNEAIMPPFEATQFGTPPDTITRKEKELSALLHRVLEEPLKPVHKELGEMASGAKISGNRLKDIADELSSVDDNIKTVEKILKFTLASQFEQIDNALREIAVIARRSEMEAAERDRQLQESLNASRLEAREAMRVATINVRIMQIFLVTLLMTFVVHFALEVRS